MGATQIALLLLPYFCHFPLMRPEVVLYLSHSTKTLGFSTIILVQFQLMSSKTHFQLLSTIKGRIPNSNKLVYFKTFEIKSKCIFSKKNLHLFKFSKNNHFGRNLSLRNSKMTLTVLQSPQELFFNN